MRLPAIPQVGSLASEEPRPHMDFLVWGELERLVCREDPRYRQPEGASEALLGPYLPAPGG